MTARARLSLLLTAVIVLGVLVVVALLQPPAGNGMAAGVESAASPFDGATRGGAASPHFQLPDQKGQETTLAQFHGRPVIMTFVYSTCTDTCPATAQQIAGALDVLRHPVPTLLISVDPAQDTPGTAQRFLNKMRLGGRARYLLGTRAQLAPIWKAYGIQPQGAHFEHSAYVLVLDGEGRQQVAFPVSKLTSDDLAHDVRVVQAMDASHSAPSPAR